MRKFQGLSNNSLEVSSQKLKKHTISTQDNPCFFPHSDIEVYNRNIYVASKDGLMSASCNKKTKYGISSRPEKKWDGPVTGMSASYRTLAIAAGDEGLYELPLGPDWDGMNGDEPSRLSDGICNDCSWAYYSIFGSSFESGFLASYRQQQDSDRVFSREFDGIIPAHQIFGSRGFSWGVHDKLCQAVGSGIKVVKYSPWYDDDRNFQEMGIVSLEDWKGEIVSASVASFGVVVEAENAIVVFPSAGPSVTFEGEPINWRIFPRSKNYENQLHIIYDDRLEIFSFNHDYLVDQESKISGVYTRADRDRGKRKVSINSLQDILNN